MPRRGEELRGILLRRRGEDIPGHSPELARQVVDRRLKKRETEALSWLAAAGASSSDLSEWTGALAWSKAQPPQDTFDAIRTQYPKEYGPLSDSEIVDRMLAMPDESRVGLINGVKGKLFEMRVVDKLNDGDQIGSVALGEGQHAALADSATNPGSDILIFNEDGSIAYELSAKCSENVGVVTEALSRYPDIPVVGNEELAALHGSVLDSGISNEALSEGLADQMEVLESAEQLSDLLEPVGFLAPGLPLFYVAVVHGKPVLTGQSTVRKAIMEAWPDAAFAGVLTAISAGMAFFDLGLFSLPLLIGVRHRRKSLRAKRYVENMAKEMKEHLQAVLKSSDRLGVLVSM